MAGFIFCGFLLVLAFWGILNSQRRAGGSTPLSIAIRAMNLYNFMLKEKFQYYCIAFVAQLPAVVCGMTLPRTFVY